MKRFLLPLLMLVSSFASAQVLTKDDVAIQNNSFSYIYQTDVPLTELFGKVNQWVAKSFNDYKSVIQYEDKDNHRLIVKGMIVSNGVWEENLNFAMTFDCKEGKYRVVTDGMMIQAEGLEFAYDRYIGVTVTDIYPLAFIGLNTLQAEYDVAFEKFEKAKKRWKPKQFHYEGPKQEFEEAEARLNKVLSKKNSAEAFLKTRESDIRQKIADMYNSISSFISAEDDF